MVLTTSQGEAGMHSATERALSRERFRDSQGAGAKAVLVLSRSSSVSLNFTVPCGGWRGVDLSKLAEGMKGPLKDAI